MPVCLMNNVDENEYIYNRYFPLISIFCLLLMLLPVYIEKNSLLMLYHLLF